MRWEEFKTSKRVMIHLASASLTHQQRFILQKAGELDTLESHHFGRLCDIRDPNVDVILVTRSPVGENLLEYYDRLLQLIPAIRSGKADAQSSQRSRYLIVVPEAVNTFDKPGCPPLCLSSLLKYSPRALQLMRSFIKNRPVLIVPGAANHIDDYYVADYFSAALLAPSLQVAKLFNAKATVRRVVSMLSEKQLAEKRTGETDLDAKDRILQAPGDYNVYEEEQFYDTLAQLITANLPSCVYAFKIDFSYNGLGTATLQLDQYLASFKWANEQRYWRGPSNWDSRQLQEPVYRRILSEVPRLVQTFLVPTNRVAFPNARAYLVQFLTYGGVIEAMPPANDWASLSTEMVIYPDKILTENCIARGLMGYFTIDFVTFFHEESLVRMLADADFAIDAQTGAHQLLATPISRSPAVGNLNPPQIRKTQLYAVVSANLSHSCLALIHYPVLLRICHALGIGFSLHEKEGSAFTLFNELRHENLGMISVGGSLQKALRIFINHLKLLHTEITSPKVQGQGCVSDCIKEGTSILELIQENVKNAARRKEHPTTSTDTSTYLKPTEISDTERRQPLAKIRTKSSIDTIMTAPTLPRLANLKNLLSFGRF
ncbi:hypothetical protein AAHC03_024539 [Spirometra sp. Aus1]